MTTTTREIAVSDERTPTSSAAIMGASSMADDAREAYRHEVAMDGDTKVVVCRAYGMQIDEQRDDDGTRDWGDLIEATMPAIRADIELYGIYT